MKIVQNIVHPITISTQTRTTDLRVSLIVQGTQQFIDIRPWSVKPNGEAVPHKGGMKLSLDEAAALRDALKQVLS